MSLKLLFGTFMYVSVYMYMEARGQCWELPFTLESPLPVYHSLQRPSYIHLASAGIIDMHDRAQLFTQVLGDIT